MYSQLRQYGWRPLEAAGHIALWIALLTGGLACAGADLLGGWEQAGRLVMGQG
ncbi:hypothetical protein SAMN02799631_04850 [Methylobacterium sp. 174MFSha1.1]|uniref:hypothetical protein n=1 Tax=Methylobacterium sp. 174MFSha1.1 TaxID=1502749 RepID=UPI0008E689D0|nr:hypothetical protein [Methylobacterium sp. 174MFSha1.1]SFV09316.1 hypothetical protein SAMN02799631_04850 [Methylobacterium sp. 174MFSha1.1]